MTSIPRTLASAKRQGFKSVNINEKALTTAQRASRIDIVGPGAKTGHIVSIIQDRDDPNSWLVKYIDSSGGFTYLRVPKGQPIPPDP